MLDLIWSLFGWGPRWAPGLAKNGAPAVALAQSDPVDIKQLAKNIDDYDRWVEFIGVVEPPGGRPYEAHVKCRLSQAVAAQIRPGLRINVKYDPKAPNRVVVAEDVVALLKHRIRG